MGCVGTPNCAPKAEGSNEGLLFNRAAEGLGGKDGCCVVGKTPAPKDGNSLGSNTLDAGAVERNCEYWSRSDDCGCGCCNEAEGTCVGGRDDLSEYPLPMI